jgi:hypothetical protein
MRFAIGFILGAIIAYPIVLFAWVNLVMPDSRYGGGHGVAAIAGPSVLYSGLYMVAPLGALIAGLALGFWVRRK